MCFKFICITERKWACTPEHKAKYFSSYSDAFYILFTGKIDLRIESSKKKTNIWPLFWWFYSKNKGRSNSWNYFLEVRLLAELFGLVRAHYSDGITLFACVIPFEAHTKSELWCTETVLVKKKVAPPELLLFLRIIEVLFWLNPMVETIWKQKRNKHLCSF